MKRVLLVILISFLSFEGFGQSTFVAQSAGNWNDGATWGNTSPGVEGVDWPGGTDDVFTNGFSVTVNSARSVRDIFVEDIAGSLIFQGQLTVNGTMIGWSGGEFGFATEITQNVFTGNSNITFTAADLSNQANFNVFNNEIIAYWNNNSPIVVARFILINDATIDVGFSGGNLRFTQFVILSGNLSTGFSIEAIELGSVIQINSGANFTTTVPIHGTSGIGSFFNQALINTNSTLNLLGNSASITASTFTIRQNAVLNTSFNGSNQTQGWWHLNNAPASFSIDPTSSISFVGNSAQNIPAITYGNLNLNSPTNVSNKNLIATGNINVRGNLDIQSSNVTFNTASATSDIQIGGNLVNNGTWNPTLLVRFNGTIAQSISGGNPTTFWGGVRFENSMASVSLSNQNIIVENEFDIDPGATFNPDDRNVTLNGALVNDGTLVAGTTNSNFLINSNTEISGVGLTNFRNLSISPTGSLIAPFEGEFTVRSNMTNNGVFTANSGAVNFSGTSPKNIQGSSLTAFYNLNVINNAVVNVQGNSDLMNVLTLGNGVNFDADGSGSGIFTLKSTDTRDAAIGPIGTANISGNFTIERRIQRRDPSLDRGFHIVGFPATGVTVADIQQELPVNGTFTGASGYNVGGINPNNPSLYRYVENVNASFTQQQRYVAFPPSTNTTAFTAGEGYHLFTFTGLAPATINGRGSLFRGNFTRTLTYTGMDPDAGWHTIANPYPAPSDWAQWIKTNIMGSTAFLFDPQSGNYIPLDGSSQQLIPQGQGVFVRANSGGGSVAATENTKVTGVTPTFYRGQNTPLERFEIILRKDSIEDVGIVSFMDGATDAYEPEYDAIRLLNIKETFSTLSSDGRSLKVNRLAKPKADQSCGRSIFLNFEQMVEGTQYFLEFRDLDFVSNYHFTLIDHYLNQQISVDQQSSIEFTVDADMESKGSGRFELLFENNQPNQLSLVGGEVCPEQNALLQIATTQSNIAYSIYKDSTLISSFAGTGQAQDVTIENSFLILGENDFDVYAKNGACDSVKVGSEVFTLLESLTYDNEVSGSMVCDKETFAPFEIYTQNGAHYFILQNNDTLLSFAGNGSLYTGQISTADLVDGINTLIVGVEKDGCQSGTLDQNLEITVDALSIDEAVSYYGNSTCDISKGKIVINTQDNISYDIFKGGQLVANVTGTGKEVQSDINQNLLSVGTNQFKIVAKYGICASYEFPEMAQITIDPLETPQIIVSGNLLESNIDADSYIWLLNGEILPNETNKNLVVTIAGNYTLDINKGACAASSNSINISETVLSSNDALTNVVNIYPNPVSEVLRISVEDINDIKVTIFTLSGQFVNKYSLRGAENTIDVSRLDKGTYLIQLETEKGSTTKRIVKK